MVGPTIDTGFCGMPGTLKVFDSHTYPPALMAC